MASQHCRLPTKYEQHLLWGNKKFKTLKKLSSQRVFPNIKSEIFSRTCNTDLKGGVFVFLFGNIVLFTDINILNLIQNNWLSRLVWLGTPHSHYNSIQRSFKHSLSSIKEQVPVGYFLCCMQRHKQHPCALLSQGTKRVIQQKFCHFVKEQVSLYCHESSGNICYAPTECQRTDRLTKASLLRTSLSKQCELWQYTTETLHEEQSRVCTCRDHSEAHEEPAH